MGAYYQALDGSHRIAACHKLGICPEIIVMDLRLNPYQPTPKGWKILLEAPLKFKRIIRGYGKKPRPHDDHMGVVLDETREILREEYVTYLFDLLVQLSRKPRILEKRNG
jgi:hypothetical protein